MFYVSGFGYFCDELSWLCACLWILWLRGKCVGMPCLWVLVIGLWRGFSFEFSGCGVGCLTFTGFGFSGFHNFVF